MTTISNIDFHCHTNASDGAFSPEQVVQRAFARGLNYLAISDHDLTAGIALAQQEAQRLNTLLLNNDPNAPQETYIKPGSQVIKVDNGTLERSNEQRLLTIIPAAEFSTTWKDEQIHVVALCLDPQHELIKELEADRKVKRKERAIEISKKLELLGFESPYERCCAKAAPGATITRGNYARLIFEDGKANSVDEAFNQYLKRGQKAYVKTQWDSLEHTVESIVKSNAIAILAHPRRYKISNGRLRKLVMAFKDCGGVALEVSSSQQKEDDRNYLTQLCQEYDLMASLGSDFHNEGIYRDLGQNLDLPSVLKPVWHHERARAFNLGPEIAQRVVHITYKGNPAVESA